MVALGNPSPVRACRMQRFTRQLSGRPTPVGHTEIDSTVRYLGIVLEDALTVAEGIEI